MIPGASSAALIKIAAKLMNKRPENRAMMALGFVFTLCGIQKAKIGDSGLYSKVLLGILLGVTLSEVEG